MNTIRCVVYAVLVIAMLSGSAMAWEVSLTSTSWDNYWNGYQWVTPTYGYGGYGYGGYGYGYPAYYAPTYYVQPTQADVIYGGCYGSSGSSGGTSVVYVSTPPSYGSATYITSGSTSTSTSGATCGDGWCASTESSSNCPADCGSATTSGSTAIYCGDGACNGGETKYNCPTDCGRAPYCGDAHCDNSETQFSCPQDCGLGDYCGDGDCNGAETEYSCPRDCGLAPYCGDGTCNNDETKYNCAIDCGLLPYCGDGSCNGLETSYTCALDCDEPKCASPSGEGGDKICEHREILVCEGGFWDFVRSVECCEDWECPNGYECSDSTHTCKAKHINYCGDGACNNGETPYNCPQDCVQPVTEYCGDGACNNGETCSSCSSDCGQCNYCGDGVCNIPGESQYSCPQDCGAPLAHGIVVTAPDECFEIEQGKSGNFTIVLENSGTAREDLFLSASGAAAGWVSQPYSVVAGAGEIQNWQLVVNVPSAAELGLYNITVTASNANVQGSTLLHVDVKLPPVEGSQVAVTTTGSGTTGGNATASTPTGAAVTALNVPDWAIVLAVLVVIGAVLAFLLFRTSTLTFIKSPAAKTSLTPDGGIKMPSWAMKEGARRFY